MAEGATTARRWPFWRSTHLEFVQAAESAWMRLPFPGRTLALRDDLDPDGDARDLFTDLDADGDGIGNAADIVAHATSSSITPM